MCFVKSTKVSMSKEKEQPIVQRHEADASLTKRTNQTTSGYQQNLKTSPVGLTDNEAKKEKQLLGE